MITFRRALQLAPPMAMLIVAVAWAISTLGMYAVSFALPFSKCEYSIIATDGSVYANYHRLSQRVKFYWYPSDKAWHWRKIPGEFSLALVYKDASGKYWQAGLPFSVVLTALAPLAAGAFTGFRFRLRHYLAYTALIAAELAYYFAPGST